MVKPARMAWEVEQARLSREQGPLTTFPSFSPRKFQYDKHQIRFFVQDASTAYALKDVSYKMCDEDSYKIPIFVNPSEVPYSVKNRLTRVQMEQ
ncbi:Nuclear RNA export factor 2, partial [Lemmus lemmus]